MSDFGDIFSNDRIEFRRRHNCRSIFQFVILWRQCAYKVQADLLTLASLVHGVQTKKPRFNPGLTKRELQLFPAADESQSRHGVDRDKHHAGRFRNRFRGDAQAVDKLVI